MPLKSGRLTPQEGTFVRHMVQTNDPVEAARRAGYTQPSSRGGALMQRPAVVAQVQAAVAHRLQTEGAQVGVGTLIEIAGNKQAPTASRVMAARELVKLSGVAAGDDANDKPLHTLSRAELIDAAAKARDALAELDAPVIEGDVLPAGGVFE
jgi:phage terminase small subunit